MTMFLKIKKYFLMILLNLSIKADSLYKLASNQVPVVNLTFYEIGKKFLIPNIIFSKSFKYIDLYCGGSIGYDFYFVNRPKFRLGFISARIDFFNMILDTILIRTDNDISYFKCFTTVYDGSFSKTLLSSFLNNLVVSIVNIKISAFTIHFFEFDINSLLELFLTFKYNYDDDISRKYNKRIRTYFILKTTIPSLRIDILKLINLSKKK